MKLTNERNQNSVSIHIGCPPSIMKDSKKGDLKS